MHPYSLLVVATFSAFAACSTTKFSDPIAQLEAGAPDASGDVGAADAGEDAAISVSDAGEDTGSAPAPAPPLALGPPSHDPSYCATRDGKVYCWGTAEANNLGALGFTAQTGRSNPTPVPSIDSKEPSHLHLGIGFACSVYDGKAYCRGAGGNRANGVVASHGVDETQVAGLPGTVTQLAGATWSTCILTTDTTVGNVYCWGNNNSGELGRAKDDPRSNDQAWPANTITGVGEGIVGAKFIAGGDAHYCAIVDDNTKAKVVCWGRTDYYQSGPTSPADNCVSGYRCSPAIQPITLPANEVPKSLALGLGHSCALMESGAVYCWGDHRKGQLGVAAASLPPCDLPAQNNEISRCSKTPVKVERVADAVAITAGLEITCARLKNREVRCWGSPVQARGNGGSEAGVATVLDETSQKPMKFDQVVGGGHRVCGRVGRDLYCWGESNLGMGDDAGISNAPFPKKVFWP